ncbi:DUF7005 family protein [Stenomitos frigidus]|uniref:Uncharacterized protein n=1 Tax=Stenomitos frigidus ULC18 TaxID=2107698 RepID=A0A2T1ECW9_9CYAN|nr:hypothetical protein [Stenomitos frigidus]PSB30545.1 hypothetical protein C7B82_08770 [Stenomitos frigidus ULC18]
MDTTRRARRAEILAAYGAVVGQVEELLVYSDHAFAQQHLEQALTLPLEPESHVATWQQYAAIAQEIGAFEALKQRLVQLQFPIQAGISQTDAYRAATRKGISPTELIEATGLVLQQPDQLELVIHESLAGAIPVLMVSQREDFVALVQALALRNEPKPVLDSMGACIVSGFNNWDRIRQYRQQWETTNPTACSESDWVAEFQRVAPQKALYQDRFIILSDGPYSAVSASAMGLPETDWQRLSSIVRLEHECTHYFTYRVLGSMRNHLLDELIADYWGIVAAAGRYHADWFLRFVGLEAFPPYREGGRLQNYRGQPPLSEGAFQVLGALVQAAARNLERFDVQYRCEPNQPRQDALVTIALTQLTLEELASDAGVQLIQAAYSVLITGL